MDFRITTEGMAPHADQTTGIESEVEAFLMQGKSILDILAKTLDPLLGLKARTFGGKGSKLVATLRRNVPKQKAQRAEKLVELIEQDANWLKAMIGERDTVAHFRALVSSGFVVKRVDGQLYIAEPQDENGNSFRTMLETLFFNLVSFVEDFIALAIHIAMPAGLTLALNREDESTDYSQPRFVLAFAPGSLPTSK